MYTIQLSCAVTQTTAAAHAEESHHIVEQQFCNSDSCTRYFARESGGEVLWWARLSVCLSVREHIYVVKRAIFTNFFVHAATAVARSSSGRVTKSQGKGNFGGFLPIANAL